MPDCCEDHKLMNDGRAPFHHSPGRLRDLPVMTFSASLSTVRAALGRGLLAATLALPFVAPSQPSFAQQRVPIVRDAEIEALVRNYARPIFQAAGLTKSGIDIVLVNDSSFNAFVAGRRMFINTGALMTAETPNEIIGVIAHEAGHLAGGHQERLRDQLARSQTMAIVAALLGLGAAVAGAAAARSRGRRSRNGYAPAASRSGRSARGKD